MRSTAYRIPQSARQIASRCAIVPRNQAHQSPLSAPFTSVRALSSSSRRSTVLDTISSVAQSVKELVTPEKKGYVEGDKQREEGLRMLMFGKPGSGKVCRISPKAISTQNLSSRSLITLMSNIRDTEEPGPFG